MTTNRDIVPGLETHYIETEFDKGHGRPGVHELDEVAQRVRVRQDIVEGFRKAVRPFARID